MTITLEHCSELRAPPSAGGGAVSGGGPVNAVNGVATFDVSLDVAETGYTLQAAATGRTADISDPFDITTAGASQLAFSTQPTDAIAGETVAEQEAVFEPLLPSAGKIAPPNTPLPQRPSR